MSHPDDGVLQELLDGELAPADEAVVRAHIAGCAPCTTALAELKAIQLEADGIVARLDLDPPLRRAAARSRPGTRRVNLRMLGLAASAVLVAGTSWMLFRSSSGRMLQGGSDAGSGIVLPLPSEERAEVPASTEGSPAAPPATGAGAEKKDAAGPAMARRADAPRQQPEKEAAAVTAELDAAPAANATPPMPSAAPPAAASRLSEAAAPQFRAKSLGNVSDAEQRLGTRLLGISGLTPQSVEVTADSPPVARQRYLVGGITVVLVQQAMPNDDLKAEAPRDEVTSKQRGLASADAREPVRRYWKTGGNLMLLEGALPPDSIDALMKRVR